jgi:hypothetical protein
LSSPQPSQSGQNCSSDSFVSGKEKRSKEENPRAS